MEPFLIFLAVILGGFGIIGAVAPVIPGPIASWVGYLVLYFRPDSDISGKALIITLVFALLITILDYYIPIFGAKKFGSTRQGILGGIIGLLIGIFFFPPVGIILGPFLGTIVGDLAAGNNIKTAIKSGTGALTGFIVGTFIKLIYSAVIIVLIFIEAGEYIYGLF